MNIDDRQKLKKEFSIWELQTGYFRIIEHAFGELYDKMLEFKSDPYTFARWYASDEYHVRQTTANLPDFMNLISEYWADVEELTWIHCEDLEHSKAVFGGEVFPDGDNNVASTCGLYLDTIILPDPFQKLTHVIYKLPPNEQTNELIRLGLQVLKYKTLALTELTVPIVVILPDKFSTDEYYRETLTNIARDDAVKHISSIFDKEFCTIEEVLEYANTFTTIESLVRSIKHQDLVQFTAEGAGNIEEQIIRYMNNEGKIFGINRPGLAVTSQTISRMFQANDVLQRSFQLRGVPVIQAETSWKWFNWKLGYDAQISDLVPLHISRGLQNAVDNEMPWLGNIPIDALIEIRKQGAINEIREILTKGIKEIENLDPSDFIATSTMVIDNLKSAFTEHQEQINKLKAKKWKFAGRDIGSFVAIGSIEVAAAITSSPYLGVASVVAGMSGLVPNAKDVYRDYTQLIAEGAELRQSPVGMLFKHKK